MRPLSEKPTRTSLEIPCDVAVELRRISRETHVSLSELLRLALTMLAARYAQTGQVTP